MFDPELLQCGDASATAPIAKSRLRHSKLTSCFNLSPEVLDYLVNCHVQKRRLCVSLQSIGLVMFLIKLVSMTREVTAL